jgi:DNA-3-methyladenine glycosylase
MRRFDRDFYRQSTPHVARHLLGALLIRRLDGQEMVGRIVETEAYHESDQAAHCYRGKTARNAPMYADGGTAYVYFVYGMHHCFNVVTEPAGQGAAVLIRAVEPLAGVAHMRARRGQQHADRALCNGPGKLAQAFGIDRALSGHDMLQQNSEVFVVLGENVADASVVCTARIGVGGDSLAKTRLWRWLVVG